MDKDLLLATTNQGKIREMQVYLNDLPIRIVSLHNLTPIPTFPETGSTFAANARGKSLYYSLRWDGLTLAEDSGLEIDFLKGAPGVISARFAGPEASDEDNIAKVLLLMGDAAPDQRGGRFISCLALAQKGVILTEIRAHVEGSITTHKRGHAGFGYDPIFYYPALDKTFAELDPAEKNAISHRGRALTDFKAYLQNYLFAGQESGNPG